MSFGDFDDWFGWLHDVHDGCASGLQEDGCGRGRDRDGMSFKKILVVGGVVIVVVALVGGACKLISMLGGSKDDPGNGLGSQDDSGAGFGLHVGEKDDYYSDVELGLQHDCHEMSGLLEDSVHGLGLPDESLGIQWRSMVDEEESFGTHNSGSIAEMEAGQKMFLVMGSNLQDYSGDSIGLQEDSGDGSGVQDDPCDGFGLQDYPGNESAPRDDAGDVQDEYECYNVDGFSLEDDGFRFSLQDESNNFSGIIEDFLHGDRLRDGTQYSTSTMEREAEEVRTQEEYEYYNDEGFSLQDNENKDDGFGSQHDSNDFSGLLEDFVHEVVASDENFRNDLRRTTAEDEGFEIHWRSRLEREAEKVETHSVLLQRNRAKSIKHYSGAQKILLVGEGNFSFSACLAKAFGSATNMVATSLDSRDFILKHYGIGGWLNLSSLEGKGCKVIHEIDATTMASHVEVGSMTFDIIVYNFPHAGFKKSEPRTCQLKRHRSLVRGFFENATRMLSNDGEIHVSHKTNGFFRAWRIEDLATQCGLRIIDKTTFRLSDYPGYETKYGFGGNKNFDCNPSMTYKFALSSNISIRFGDWDCIPVPWGWD